MIPKSKQIAIKYAFDRVGAALLLALLTPALAIIAGAIKLFDGGPIFFRQNRPGLNSVLFSVWKFRTMIVDADRFLDHRGRTMVNNRVTRIGWLLRKLSLDELPQLINILKGEMSFVGPRPTSCEHLPKMTKEQMRRFEMKPGLTGLAQVNGRNTLKWSQRIRLDVQYIDQYSLWLDFVISLKTVRVVLLQEGVVLDRNAEDVDDLGVPKQGDSVPGRKAA